MPTTERLAMDTVALLRHHREKAFNAATILLALATSPWEPDATRDALRERHAALVEDFIHEFALSARKYIDAATALGVPFRNYADKAVLVTPAFRDSDDPGTEHLRSLYWVLSRVIHCKHIQADIGSVGVEATDPPRFAEQTWGFTVASDWDHDELKHLVFLEFLLDRFVQGELLLKTDVDAAVAAHGRGAA